MCGEGKRGCVGRDRLFRQEVGRDEGLGFRSWGFKGWGFGVEGVGFGVRVHGARLHGLGFGRVRV